VQSLFKAAEKGDEKAKEALSKKVEAKLFPGTPPLRLSTSKSNATYSSACMDPIPPAASLACP
jgi:hypothetical protein